MALRIHADVPPPPPPFPLEGLVVVEVLMSRSNKPTRISRTHKRSRAMPSNVSTVPINKRSMITEIRNTRRRKEGHDEDSIGWVRGE
jgi:hypothetical protein